MAAGGQGAPLTPYLDYLLLSHPTENRAVQNLGGIGNVAYLPAGGGPESVIAFDTGPANALIDGAASSASTGNQSYDKDGRMAASAPVDEHWLELLMTQTFESFLSQPPPKSTGRELFSLKLLDLLQGEGVRGKRLVSTLTQLTVETVADQYERWLGPIDQVILTGGGARNPELVKRLRARLAHTRVVTLDELGLDSTAREALAFAVMGYETLCGRTSTLPATTGASRAVIQGKIVLA
jgi:anhydro-N-acetylmuramic acid kinase